MQIITAPFFILLSTLLHETVHYGDAVTVGIYDNEKTSIKGYVSDEFGTYPIILLEFQVDYSAYDKQVIFLSEDKKIT